MKKRTPLILRFFSINEIWIGIIMTLFSLSLLFYFHIPFFETLALKLYDLNFQMRGTVETPKDVVIVAIDQKSQEKLGRWPWSRKVLADLVNRLDLLGAKAIGLDIVFSYPEVRPDFKLAKETYQLLEEKKVTEEGLYQFLRDAAREADVDSQLVASFKNSGKVVPGYFFFTESTEIENLDLDLKADYKNIRKSKYSLIKYPPSGRRDFMVPTAVGVKPNIKKITKASKTTGYFNVYPDIADGTVRRVSNVVRFNKRYFPPLSLQVLRAYFGEEQFRLLFKEEGVEGIEVGGRVIPTDEVGRTLVNFYGPEGQFPIVPIVDVLEGGLPDKQLLSIIKDKIILIGATATGIYDLRITPFGTEPGVEIHASYIQNVLDGNLLKKAAWTYIFDGLSIMAIGILLVIILRKSGPLIGAFSALGLIVIYFLLQRYFFIEKYIVLDIFYPLLSIVLIYGTIALFKYTSEAQEKRFIRSAFSQYLSPAVITELVKDPSRLQLGGVRKEITAFFSDIAGFSTISEKLSAEELVQLLNEYLTAMTDILLEHGGTVDKYEGDAIIAFYGAPVEYKDHAKRCCFTAIAMQEKLEEMRKKWKEEGRHELLVRIGINTGPAVVGNMGSKTRMDYTMMGDSVNLASRLEGANKQYGSYTMISEFAYEACKEDIEVRELDKIRVMGKSQPVVVYELLCRKGDLSENQKEIVDLYAKGLEAYKTQNWEEAMDKFSAALEKDAGDGPSATYLERCIHYMENPPGEGWSGVYVMQSK